MKQIEKVCLSCKYFRTKTIATGICRVDKNTNPVCLSMQHTDSCSRWHDCGQQYYIRSGWIKNQKVALLESQG